VKPYTLDGRLVVDVQQLIPLPEAQEYQVRFKEKRREERVASVSSKDYTRFDVLTDGTTFRSLPKRRAIYIAVKTLCERGISPEQIIAVSHRGGRTFRSVEREVDAATFATLAAPQKRSFDPRRWYCDDDELIHANGRTYALNSQWGTNTAEFHEQVLAAFPELGVTVQASESP
jgi:hypothetical protein